MSREGDKPTKLEIDDSQGRVILRFGMKVDLFAFEPGEAVRVAEAMVEAAKRAGWVEPVIWMPKKH